MNPAVGLQAQLAQGMASGSPMNIATPGSPTFQQGLTAPSIPMPDKSPATNFTPHQMSPAMQAPMPQQGQPQQMMTLPIEDANAQAPGVQVPESEASLILKSLDHRLENISKVQEMVTAFHHPQPQQEAV